MTVLNYYNPTDQENLKQLIVDMLPYLLLEVEDEGPGWKSEKLIDLINRAYEAIGSELRLGK